MTRGGCLPVGRRPQLLGLLPEREAWLLRRHCIEGHSLSELAREGSVSPAFVSQLHRRASKRLGQLVIRLLRSDPARAPDGDGSERASPLGVLDDWLPLETSSARRRAR